jgi:hypothetical protein
VATSHVSSFPTKSYRRFNIENQVCPVMVGAKNRASNTKTPMKHCFPLDQTLLEYFREALVIERTKNGDVHVAVAKMLNLIGNIYLQRAEVNNFMNCYTEAFRIYKRQGQPAEDPPRYCRLQVLLCLVKKPPKMRRDCLSTAYPRCMQKGQQRLCI